MPPRTVEGAQREWARLLCACSEMRQASGLTGATRRRHGEHHQSCVTAADMSNRRAAAAPDLRTARTRPSRQAPPAGDQPRPRLVHSLP